MKVILYSLITPNGLIARENGDEDFLSNSSWGVFVSIVNDIGCLVWGKRTYEAVSGWSADHLDQIKNVSKYLLTRDKNYVPQNGFKVTYSPQEAIEKLANEGFEKMVVSGGSTTYSSFMEKGLIDEMIINIEPYLLSKGIPIFKPVEFEYKLKLQLVKHLDGGLVQLRYVVEK